MKKERQLKIVTGIFLFYLISIAVNRIDILYIPLKHSIVDGNVPEICIYISELISLTVFGVALAKTVSNIGNQQFFIKKNVNNFRTMTIALFIPPTLNILGSLFDSVHDWDAYHMDISLWYAGALFIGIISLIFKNGMKLKEEQDLTV